MDIGVRGKVHLECLQGASTLKIQEGRTARTVSSRQSLSDVSPGWAIVIPWNGGFTAFEPGLPPIVLRTVGTSDEMAFFVEYSTFQPLPNVSDLSYELAQYPAGSDFLGPGQVVRSGPLSSLNASGALQYHDMPAEGEFSPGNDFFILKNPPPMTVQLRILDPSAEAIAWNMIVGCV